jgi:WAS family protein 1
MPDQMTNWKPPSVPIAFQNLRPPESYLQAFHSLEELSKVVDDVFNRISSRISYEKSRIQEVTGRLSIAQTKVKQIQSSTKSTKVLSPAKYPAPNHIKDYVPLFSVFEKEDKSLKKKPSYHLLLREIPLV